MVWAGDVHEAHRADLGTERLEHAFRLGALEGQQRLVVVGLEPDVCRQVGGDVGPVGRLAGGVDDEEDPPVGAGLAREHQVVEDAAFGVEQLRIALAAFADVQHVGRHQRLERLGGGGVVGAEEGALAHVGDVEEAGVFAGPGVLGDDAGRVLDRHEVAGKGHHPRAEGDVRGGERGLENGGIGGRSHWAHSGIRLVGRRSDRVIRSRPLCRTT